MTIIEKNIDELIPYENNPRFNDNAVAAVAASIEEFGFKVPCVIDSEGVLVTGHTRYKAAKRLGLKKIPCIVADDLTDEEIRAYRIADNKVGEYSIWEYDALKEETEALKDVFDMSEFGFIDLARLPAKEEAEDEEEIPAYDNQEIDLEEFSDEQFAHTCERCGFKWN